MPAPAQTSSLFAAYHPAPLNDAGAPPFPALEADEEDEQQASAELDVELPIAEWRAIPPAAPTADAPVRFVDGSIATRTVGALVVDYRRRPLIAAVVSAAALEMDGRSLRRGAGACTSKLLCLFSDGIDRDAIAEAAHALASVGVQLRERTATSVPPDFDSMRRAARSLAMEAMEQHERQVLFADVRKPTLVDGLLERRLAAAPSHDVPATGLVKRQMATYLPPALQELAYALTPGERTPAFVLRTVQHVDLLNTYVRLSSQAGASPSYGIVRITAPLAYVQRAHPGDQMPAYLSGLASHLYALRHRDYGYSRAGISVEPIVRVEDHLHAILPQIESLIPKLHRMLAGATSAEHAS